MAFVGMIFCTKCQIFGTIWHDDFGSCLGWHDLWHEVPNIWHEVAQSGRERARRGQHSFLLGYRGAYTLGEDLFLCIYDSGFFRPLSYFAFKTERIDH